MKTRNRILGILLVTIMVLAIVPFSAMTVFADSGYTVTLYANDGQGTQEQIENVSGLYVLPECSFTAPPEMTFLAWAIGSQSGELFAEIKLKNNLFTFLLHCYTCFSVLIQFQVI